MKSRRKKFRWGGGGLLRPAGSLVAGMIRQWMGTLDFMLAYYDPSVDPAYAGDGRIRLYLFWHEYMPFFIHLRHHCRLAMLLSRHADADLLEQLAHGTGFETVRGSTGRTGAAALTELTDFGKRGNHLTITPDGPRGPRRTMAPGAIYLASRMQIPIVAIGVGYNRPWRLPTWDRFAIPRWGSRARAVASGEIVLPPNLSREGIDHYTQRVGRLLNRLTDQAEDWATGGYTIAGASSLLPGPKHSMFYFAHPKPAEIAIFLPLPHQNRPGEPLPLGAE